MALKSCGQGIWFVPSVFRWPWVALDTRETVPHVVSYGARGAGRVWQQPGRGTPTGLPDLLGRSRALILESLDVPRSTTTLSQSLGLSLSTVSEHLSVLAACRSPAASHARRDGCAAGGLSGRPWAASTRSHRSTGATERAPLDSVATPAVRDDRSPMRPGRATIAASLCRRATATTCPAGPPATALTEQLRADSGVGVRMLFSSKCIGSV